MAYKNISISLEVYEELARLKRGGESFSHEIMRLLEREKPKLEDMAGILTDGEARTVEENVRKMRASASVRKW